MIRLNIIPTVTDSKKDKYNWSLVLKDDVTEKSAKLYDLELMPSSLTKKFEIVASLFEEMSLNSDFVLWYTSLIRNYINLNYNSEILMTAIPKFFEFANYYIETKNINFNSFVNKNKISKTSIVFTAEDTRAIALTSICLKLYSLFYYDNKLKPTDNIHKLIYTEFVKPCVKLDTTNKIYQIMKSRTFRSSMTDWYMWDLFKMMNSDTPESYTLNIFNFLMINLFSILDINTNPIPFIVSVTDDSIRWMMMSVYKDRIIYDEVFGGSDELYGTAISKDAVNIYCCNDAIGKAAKIGMNLLETEYDIKPEEFDKLKSRLDSIDLLTPTMKNVIAPIASKVLEIPYKYMLLAPPKHLVLIGVFMHYCSKQILDERFPIITDFLLCYSKNKETNIVRSSYRLRSLETIINDNQNRIFGLNSVTLKFEITSSVCGILSTAKKDLLSIITGEKISRITYTDMESDVTSFYTELYSGKLDQCFSKMREKADACF